MFNHHIVSLFNYSGAIMTTYLS